MFICPKLKKVKLFNLKINQGLYGQVNLPFEDMSFFWKIEKFRFNYLPCEQTQGMDCFVVEQVQLKKIQATVKP